jgi:hypothetical protein
MARADRVNTDWNLEAVMLGHVAQQNDMMDIRTSEISGF